MLIPGIISTSPVLTKTNLNAKHLLRMHCGVENKISRLSADAVMDITCADTAPDPALKDAHCKFSGMAYTSPGAEPNITYVNNCGRPMPILKTLQTSHCVFNCRYCSFARDNDRRRDTISPDEMAMITNDMTEAGKIRGLFLSSGIDGSVRKTMTRIIDTAKILRVKYGYTGYIHLKIMPGSSEDVIEEAGKYADRLSINMEAPNDQSLNSIAPNKKIHKSILGQMQLIETLRRMRRIHPRVGQITQFVVGGSDDPGENDRAFLTVAQYLYRELDFRRVYYSAFSPVKGTKLEGREPENPMRSHRLYQADRLMVDYGFTPDELVFDNRGKMSLDIDPKELWARAHPELYPVDITTADPQMILRVPGIGPTLARKILSARLNGDLRDQEDLLKLGRVNRKCLEWILIGGRMPVMEKKFSRKELQLSLSF
jgi:predicted DNA-binding helix-hairpin-helix protein